MSINQTVESILDGVETLFAWVSKGLKQTMDSYTTLASADSENTLVGWDGSLVTFVECQGVKSTIGREEFDHIINGMMQALGPAMSRKGHVIQVHFDYSRDEVLEKIKAIYRPGQETAEALGLSLDDLFEERQSNIANYTAHESMHLALWTMPESLTEEQLKRAMEDKSKKIRQGNVPPIRYTQNYMAAIPDLRDNHESFIRSVSADMANLGMVVNILDAHEACYRIRRTVDRAFTDSKWKPVLPGDKIQPKIAKQFRGEVADVLWPSLAKQLMPRDAVNLDLRTCRVGDCIYSSVFIDLFPKEVQSFMVLFARAIETQVPWRISFLIDGGGLDSLRIKRAMSGVLAFSSQDNRLLNDACQLLDYINTNTDDACVKLRVVASTWADVGNHRQLRANTAQLARAIESWGSCDVSEICGDAFQGIASSMLGITSDSPATATVASFQDTLKMLPLFRPASPWQTGSMLFRSPDGKLWPYQPGSPMQSTWIDLVFARPGSGKSVLSNAMNLALCLSSGLMRLPRIAIIDIGPSSAGLISLLQEALPVGQKHYAAYHRIRMTPDYAINPFDTQLGCRFPSPQERSFLVNFVTLLATPVGAEHPYDGIGDMAGLVIDEAYKAMADDSTPNVYALGVEEEIDKVLDEIEFVPDIKTSWWEVADALFMAGFTHQAMLAQRNAVPLLSDTVSICRSSIVEDLYGKVKAPTGETLIDAFVRMISAAVREYPVLSRVTQFDIGDSRVVSLDLDEVAKGGGGAGDRQTAVMYMLARFAMAKDYYLTMENLGDVANSYRAYHEKRIAEIRDDPKRIVYDEFHRTSAASAVREQVIQDMREGRKWNVQISLLSQSLDDFDSVMVEFGTAIFIMDAGPEQAIQRTRKVFGLSETSTNALRTRVHGPRKGGATFLAQFSTKDGMNSQLLTLTLGPIELWAFSTTSADANLRNQLYAKIGPREARRVLATIFPDGTASKYLQDSLEKLKEETGMVEDEVRSSVVDGLVARILTEYMRNPDFKRLPG